MTREYSATFFKDGDWWIGVCDDAPGANAQERTLNEARQSLKEAIADVLDVRRELGWDNDDDAEVIRERLTVDVA
jgi:predicted RNase H-like HicB family nuclease